MRMLTFNTLFRGDVEPRLRALGRRLEDSAYDVVCLQEVMYRRGARLLRTLAPSFTHHAYDGTVLLRGGLVILSRIPLGYRFAPYPLKPPLRPEFLMRKGVQVATLSTPDGRTVILNTHLSANRDDDWSAGNRYTRLQRTELSRLAGLVRGVDEHVRVIVAGDLNVPRSSPLFQDFLSEAGLRDLMAGDTRPTYRPTARWPNPPAFDHILVRNVSEHGNETGLVFENDEIPLDDGRKAYLSDHYGVAATIA